MTVSLRREIRLLSNVSKDKVLPISLVPKAEWVGKLKELEVWRSVDELLLDGKSQQRGNQHENQAEENEKVEQDGLDVVMKD